MVDISGKTILILGGTGSLGHALVRRLGSANQIFIVSRDENKQWQMKLEYPNLHFIVGNVSDRAAMDRALQRSNPHIIIAAAAMKHIDVCELNVQESINTNIIGTCNLLASIECLAPKRLESVVFISTDKACSPINNYGMCKAISETLFIEKSYRHCFATWSPSSDSKYVVVRYGNVLNSRGSIIPLLHQMGKNSDVTAFTLTDPYMTRFVMTLDQSVNLILYAILHGENGTIIVPELKAMRIHDLMTLFSERYNKPFKIIGARPGEKVHESLINESQAARTIKKDGYRHIQSVLTAPPEKQGKSVWVYNSDMNVLTKGQLEYLLITEKLLD